MKLSSKLWLYMMQNNAKKVNTIAKHHTTKKLLTTRCFSTLHQQKHETTVASDGLRKSPYPDIISPTLTIDQYIWQNLERWADRDAIECGITGKKYTYSQLRSSSKRFAASLRKQGFKPGDIVAMMLPNIPDVPVVILGALEAGLIISSINPIYTPYELSHQLHDSSSVAIITLPEFLDKIESAEKLIENKTNTAFQLKKIIVNFNSISFPTGLIDFKDMISENIDTSEIKPTRTVDDIALMPYSSGTTGLSKGVELTHKNLVSNFLQILHPEIGHLQMTTGGHQDVIPGVLPFFHIYGVSVTLLRTLSLGCKIVTLQKFEATPFLSILKDKKATVLYAVPPIVLLLGHNREVTKDHLASLRYVINGAGPVSAEDGERVIARSNKNFRFSQAYGLTETSPVVFVSPNTKQDYKTIGVPIRSTVSKIIKADGTIAGVGEIGEICIKGPQVMKGYRNKPEATKEVFDNEGFFHTGDVGYWDEEGKFHIVERMKELIKVKGFQVPPAELEALLRTHPNVLEAAVVGVPDERTGEKPLAFVTTKNHDKVTEEELKKFVADKVAPFKKLGGVIFVETIPKNPSGKILRRILKEKYLPVK